MIKRAALALAAAALLGGCIFDYNEDHALDGPWHLVAIDAPETLFLCRRTSQNDDGCSGEIPNLRVFAAGIDARYLVVAGHPRLDQSETDVDKSISQYFYLKRTADDWSAKSFEIVGPMKAEAFATEKSRLGLPDFSQRFKALE